MIFPFKRQFTSKYNQKKGFKLAFLIVFLFSTFAQAQNLNDVIISEIMADPTPTKGLPEKEYLELYNRTGRFISLNQWKFQYGNTTVTFPNVNIEANEYIIVTSNANVKDFQGFGIVVGLSSFSLNNVGNALTLKTPQNKTIFSVTYSDKWYASGKNQGFSLEMIDKNFPCVEESNWTSSTATLQGTPARSNSVEANKPDLTPPILSRFEINTPTSVKLVFSEKLDSLSAISKLAYSFDKNLIINQITIESPANRNVNLSLNAAIQENTVYKLNIKNISDCSGNVLKEGNSIIGNLKPADSSDVVLNEVLFNPRTDGEDFVEIYNRSEKIISLKDWSLANIDASGKVASIRVITANNFILNPKQFLVLTRNAKTVQNQYFKAKTENFLEISSLPSYPDESGTVVLLDANKKVFDRFAYHEDFHHPLIDEKAGVSLEKIDFNKPSSDTSNWHSAASSEGYATPGYANSQGIKTEIVDDEFSVKPEIITPDGDGMDEFANILISSKLTSATVNINIFDVNGRLIRNLAQNQILGVNDTITWDGKDSGMQVVPVGYYILLAEVFNPSGQTKQWKGKVVVGSKF